MGSICVCALSLLTSSSFVVVALGATTTTTTGAKGLNLVAVVELAGLG